MNITDKREGRDLGRRGEDVVSNQFRVTFKSMSKNRTRNGVVSGGRDRNVPYGTVIAQLMAIIGTRAA